MEKEYILVVDSGIGGLTTLSEITKHVSANFVYFADVKNAPYGSLTQCEIIDILTNIINDMLKKYRLKMVVLACNTATSSAVESLRNHFKIDIIGTEPAICLAEKLGFKKVLCLTTPTTSKQIKYISLTKKTNVKTTTLPAKTLAFCIENYIENESFLNYVTLLKEVCKISKVSKRHDCIVLGCTHYVFISNFLSNFSKKPCINGNFGVAKRVRNRLNQNYDSDFNKNNVIFECSHSTKFAKQIYKKILGQILAKLQNVC